MARIFIDNQPYDVPDGQNLLQACLSLGFDLPYFCWHPALGSVGACRQCAVKVFADERDKRGRIVMSCLTAAADGTRLSISDPEAVAFRASVIEWLMTNHPHDCPVCDEGGECHLQDMTVMTGHTYREYRFPKRTYRNQNLGPFVNHEMNRCIQCYRCVRFYCDYAGGHDLGTFAAHNRVYFGRFDDGTLESEFSGNLVEVCPTGVFTDKSLKQHYTRKWDLQTAPSICVSCGLGCNTLPGERYGQLRRILNRYHDAVNGYFLCDRGRYGYEFVNSERRLRQVRLNGQAQAVPPEQMRQLLGPDVTVIGIGSPRASLEANFALQTLAGPEHFFTGWAEPEHHLMRTVLDIWQRGPARAPSLRDVRRADAALVLGEDVTNVAPLLDLALRQTVRNRPLQTMPKPRPPEWNDAAVRELLQEARGPLFIASPAATKLDELSTATYRAAPDDLARLGFAVAHAINPRAPAVKDLPAETLQAAEQIARALKEAERPLVVSGLSCGSTAVVEAAANVAWALCETGHAAYLTFAVPEANSLGLGLLGGGSLEAALEAVRESPAATVIVLENDLYRREDAAAVNTLLDAARHVIVIDALQTPTTARAEVALPAAAFAEATGTLVNSEGRAQRFYQVFVPEGETQESWRWVRDLLQTAGRREADAWETVDDVDAALARSRPAFAGLGQLGPDHTFRLVDQKIPREPPRYSGRTAMHADQNVHELKPRDDPDTALAFSMEGYAGMPPAALTSRYWWPGWNSVQALNKFQEEVGGPLRGGDPGLRLIEASAVRPTYFEAATPPFETAEWEWLIVPLYHIFGSEETSVLTPGVAERAPAPYLGLNPRDARHLDLSDGQTVELSLHGSPVRLRVSLLPSLPAGVAALPAGVPGGPCLPRPERRNLKEALRGVP